MGGRRRSFSGNWRKSLPPNEQLLAEIDIANLWIEQADRKQKRMLQAGFTVPKELDPLHKKALVRLYELQADLVRRQPAFAVDSRLRG